MFPLVPQTTLVAGEDGLTPQSEQKQSKSQSSKHMSLYCLRTVLQSLCFFSLQGPDTQMCLHKRSNLNKYSITEKLINY